MSYYGIVEMAIYLLVTQKMLTMNHPENRRPFSGLPNYVDKFAEPCRANKIKGGVIAIATNDADEAANWHLP